MERLSVVIANYNYERYVATFIESALALRWGDVEVVVVDDNGRLPRGDPGLLRPRAGTAHRKRHPAGRGQPRLGADDR